MRSSDPFASVEDARALAQAIVDTIREPLLVLDKDLCVVAASRSFYLTFKMVRQDVQGRAVYMLGGGQWNIPELRLLLEEILPQKAVMEGYEVRHDLSGAARVMLLNARTVVTEGHDDPMILLAMEDVTQARVVERAMQDLLQQKETLLQEMQHRIVNSLQIIASILLLKARTVQSEETRLHLHDAHQRVMSVAAVQQQLHATRHGEMIELGPYLSGLCEALGLSMIGENRPISLRVDVKGGHASSSDAVSIGLLVTELVINALKHAFAHDKTGSEIIVSYEVADTGWRLAISDNGSGKAAAIPGDRGGLGTSIVEALSNQLDARVTVSSSPQGTRVSITHGFLPSLLPDAA
jgi:chemotaxis protein methyltransferase CheR